MAVQEELEARVEELSKRIEYLETEKNEKSAPLNNEPCEGIDRRQFLKKSALGITGLAALLSPASGLSITSKDLEIFTSNDNGSTLTQGLFVDQNANVEIANGNLDLSNNNLLNVNQINGQDADSLGGSGVPSGAIIMWSGAISEIPTGWTLCDGSDGAPNLQDRFIVGAGNNYSIGSTGGQNEIQLTVDEMPSHQHSLYHSSDNSPNGNTSAVTVSSYNVSGPTTNPINTSGGDQPHENRPPYYALAFIMKT